VRRASTKVLDLPNAADVPRLSLESGQRATLTTPANVP
jgi:hypothetical protein